MKLLPRLFLILTAVALACHYLPAGYWLAFGQRHRAPLIHYSAVTGDFLFTRLDGDGLKLTDKAGNELARDRFEELLPLSNWAQLSKDGRMPRQIGDTPLPLESLRRAQFSLRLRPSDMDFPSTGLVPLFEAENGRAKLEMPGDFLRLREAAEFLSPAGNTVLQEKSDRLARVLADAGFRLPAALIASNPTSRKPYDEGIYLLDADRRPFLLRQERGMPVLTRLDSPSWRTLDIRHIHVQEIDSRELRCLVITHDNRVFVALGAEHTLVHLPLHTFRTGVSSLSLRGDLLNRLVLCESPGLVEAVALDRNYRLVLRHEESIPVREHGTAGILADMLFPVAWDHSSPNSGFHGLHLHLGSPWSWAMALGLASAYLQLRRSNAEAMPREVLLDAAIILAFGLPALLVILLLPRRSC